MSNEDQQNQSTEFESETNIEEPPSLEETLEVLDKVFDDSNDGIDAAELLAEAEIVFSEFLQPQKKTFFVASALYSTGTIFVSKVLCFPSQNGCFSLKPQEHHQYLSPSLISIAMGSLVAIFGYVIFIFSPQYSRLGPHDTFSPLFLDQSRLHHQNLLILHLFVALLPYLYLDQLHNPLSPQDTQSIHV